MPSCIRHKPGPVMNRPKPDWHNFHHKEVRDLAWAVFSTPLMAQLPGCDAQLCAPGAEAADWHWLEALDRQPEPLLTALAAGNSTRLGLYFERLWLFYLQHHPRWALLAHNLPINQAGRTLGAFDFLCRQGEQFWHLELTVKFYLGVGQTAQPEAWPQWRGPDTRDRLDIKLGRLRDHQLALSQSTHSAAVLRDLAGGEVIWQRGLVMKGYYFYPGASDPRHPHPPPVGAHPRHLRGTWWYLDQFLPHLNTGHWHRPNKMAWLSPVQLHKPDTAVPGPAMQQLIRETVGEAQRPVLLTRMAPHGGAWHEQERMFVVPDYWPGTALP